MNRPLPKITSADDVDAAWDLLMADPPSVVALKAGIKARRVKRAAKRHARGQPNRRARWRRRPLTHARLLALLAYDPEAGKFYQRTVRRGVNVGERQAAPCTGEGSHTAWRVTVAGVAYSRGKLAHFAMTGRWPPRPARHLDGDPLNDAWRNLTWERPRFGKPRAAPNRLDPARPWSASIRCDGVVHCFGLHETREAAQAAATAGRDAILAAEAAGSKRAAPDTDPDA